ncbi:MAG: thiamine phosphate synthase [Thiohalomonadaceae bacterium]
MTARLRRGLYAITDARLTPGPHLADAVRAAIEGGAVAIQYRDKGGDGPRRHAQARTLAGLCRTLGAAFIVNDDPALAAAVGADGVHLGKDDARVTAARALLGPDAIIGVSCYDDLTQAERAAELGADYVAFGSFFPSTVKPDAVRADVDLLHRAKARLHLPVAAIGGITADNGAPLVAAGADLLAVISGVFGQRDVRAASQRLSRLFG